MICVTIGRGRHSSLLAEWKAAAEAGAELVELRIDCLRREPNLKRLFAERYTPVVFTIRRGTDGGLWRGDEEKRQRLLREAIVTGVEYVDLEADIAKAIRRFGKTQRVVSVHNFKKMPAELEELGREIQEADADVVKVAAMAHSPADASKMMEFVAKSPVPTIGIAMGEVGFFTRILGAKFGAPFTYSGFNPDRTFAPGQPRLHELKEDYFYDQINAETAVYGVIGDPIAQTLSPAVHNAAFRHLGLNRVMVPFKIPADSLKESLSSLSWMGLKGFSVTIPHKEAVIPLLARIDKSVDRTGACNTVVDEGGDWVGHNTDYRAAMDALEEALGGTQAGDVSPLMDKQVLILGAGGTARTIAFGLARRGAGVTLANRNDDRAARLAEEVNCRSTTWGMRASTLHDILINCTPVGMHPDVDETPVPPAAFKANTIAFDTVYHPENTMFLKLARERGCATITGVEMFVRQAALQFKYYTGLDAPIELMREVVRRKLSPVRM
jgi:3-dehydroquinate dehydratase / shikimate dehydrogenase